MGGRKGDERFELGRKTIKQRDTRGKGRKTDKRRMRVHTYGTPQPAQYSNQAALARRGT